MQDTAISVILSTGTLEKPIQKNQNISVFFSVLSTGVLRTVAKKNLISLSNLTCHEKILPRFTLDDTLDHPQF